MLYNRTNLHKMHIFNEKRSILKKGDFRFFTQRKGSLGKKYITLKYENTIDLIGLGQNVSFVTNLRS